MGLVVLIVITLSPLIINAQGSSYTNTPTNCQKIIGGGDINVFVYGEKAEMLKEGKWILSELKKQKPYKEFKFNLYYEKEKGGCKFGTNKDFRLGYEYIGGFYGWSNWDGTSPGQIYFNKNNKDKKWSFLLFHEIGHFYLNMGHSNDGSIMDLTGGNGKYNEAQIDKIRIKLKQEVTK
jgi:hypothetical protein